MTVLCYRHSFWYLSLMNRFRQERDIQADTSIQGDTKTPNQPPTQFDVHGSVHLGNVYVKLKVQLDVLFMYSVFLFLTLHVSGGKSARVSQPVPTPMD
jgi:hypothetical protein